MTSDLKAGIPGVCLRQSEIVFATRVDVTAISVWPPKARQKTQLSGTWRDVRPRFDVVAGQVAPPTWQPEEVAAPPVARFQEGGQYLLELPVDPGRIRAEWSSACQGLLGQIRDDVLTEVGRFAPGGYTPTRELDYGQWEMLEFASRSAEHLDLLRSNAVLSFCLAGISALAEGMCLDSVSSLVGRPQSEILDELGFPATKSLARAFRRMDPRDLSIPLMARLRKSIRSRPGEVLKMLQHLDRITADALRILSDERFISHASPVLLSQVLARPARGTAAKIRQIAEVCSLLGIPSRGLPYRSIAEVEERHEAVVVESERRGLLPHGAVRRATANPERVRGTVRRRRTTTRRGRTSGTPKQKRSIEFRPPFPGNGSTITPLNTRAAIRAHGVEQHNCVHSYIGRVEGGFYFLYRVVAPGGEIGTLGIRYDVTRRWVRDDLKAAGNRPPSREMSKMCREWLAECRGDRKPVRERRQSSCRMGGRNGEDLFHIC